MSLELKINYKGYLVDITLLLLCPIIDLNLKNKYPVFSFCVFNVYNHIHFGAKTSPFLFLQLLCQILTVFHDVGTQHPEEIRQQVV